MDRSRWRYKTDENSEEYLTRLSEFIRVAEDDQEKKGKLRISCLCKDSEHDTVDFDDSEDDDDDSYDSGHDNLDDMLNDLKGDIDEDNHAKFQELFVDAEKPLYAWCKKFTKQSVVFRLFDVKAANSIIDQGFTDILEVVHEFLPEDNELPISVYKAEKLICPMGLEIKRIHACSNDCVLYTKEKKGSTLWYLPIIPRLKRLFADSKDAKLFRWHAEERPKQPGNDIDVYFEPLIEAMKKLWKPDVEVYDAYVKETFSLYRSMQAFISIMGLLHSLEYMGDESFMDYYKKGATTNPKKETMEAYWNAFSSKESQKSINGPSSDFKPKSKTITIQ
ncbi:hypothetical protein Tco_0738475 [Tanacetum coccineum]